jgi:UDPglucose 6-dehydrogenase
MNISVVGLGKLGSVLAAVLADAGHHVVGVDTNISSVKAVNQGLSPVDETGLSDLIAGLSSDMFIATTDYARAIPNTDMTMIVVPTPSGPDDRFSNEYVLDAIANVGRHLPDKWHTVVVCSTVMPGTSDDVLIPSLEAASGRKVGHTVGYCYNPEFIALGSVIHDMTHPDLILIGAQDERSKEDLVELTRSYVQNEATVACLRHSEAELAKIAINTYVTMKISYANTIAEICEKLNGANASNVLQAVGVDSRIGSKYIRPGASFGGPCFPRDNKAFAALADGVGVSPSLAVATDDVNRRLYSRMAFLLRDFEKIAVLGLSYKPNTAITENSMGMMVARSLAYADREVHVHDPQARPGLPAGVTQHDTVDDTIRDVDVVLVATPWDEYKNIRFGGVKVIDLWGCTPHQANRRVVGEHCWWWTP